MASVDLNLVRVFVAALEEGSFTAAGDRLSLPRSSISRSVAALEDALGVALFRRTTRSVVTTEAGAALYKRLSTSFSSIEATLADAAGGGARPSGLVRVTTTADIGVIMLPAAISRFTARYPDVQVEVHLASDAADLTNEGFDLALRISNAPLAGASVVAQRVGRIRLQLYAAAAYLARCGVPHTPKDLAEHDWISLRNNRPPIPSRAGTARQRTMCNDLLMVRELLRSGAGVGVLPIHLAEADVDAGLLVQVLPRWFEFTGTIYLVSAARELVACEVMLLRDLIVEQAARGPIGLSRFGS